MSAINNETGLDENEQKCLDALVIAFNEFANLDTQHPDEKIDFKNGIHRLQELLAVRIVRRKYPIGWPMHGK